MNLIKTLIFSVTILDLDLPITNSKVSTFKMLLNEMIFILKQLISHYLTEVSLAPFLWCICFTAYSFCENITLVNVYVDLVVFTRIAGTS